MVSEADREDRTGRRWEIENRRGPNIGEPCENCGGSGRRKVNVNYGGYEYGECPRCLGTGVQP